MHIKLENISKFYTSTTSVTYALQKISLDFNDTGFVAITGESGSGKSTLISILSGMLTFEEGELYIDDRPMSLCDDSDWEKYRKNRIGFVFQEYNLIDEYTVFDNVESAIIIRGVRKENISAYANNIIKRVGLEAFTNTKASNLSSGQKQRLAIARALAKDADVIVADEPTGNLDSENGEKIMELFAEIAKEKLVIMVTHNFDLAKPFVNRQIRLFDGKISADMAIKENEPTVNSPNPITQTATTSTSEISQNKWNTALKYTFKNLIRQPLKSALVALFVLFTAAVSYAFMGQIISNYDDAHTRIYDDDVFAYENDRRIIVKKKNGSAFTDKDMDALSSLKYVVTTDKYDLCNDIQYTNIPGEDYYLTFRPNYTDIIIGGMDVSLNKGRYVSFNEDATPKFMRSTSAITESDLSAGRLPVARNEIVMYADTSLENLETLKIFFKNDNIWRDDYYEADFEVVGILKEETTQIYFSDAFCDMITASYKLGGVCIEAGFCTVSEKYTYHGVLTPVIDDSLKGYNIVFSEYFVFPIKTCVGMAHMQCNPFSRNTGTMNLYTDKLLTSGDIETICHTDLSVNDYSDKILGSFMCVSEEFFYEIYDSGSHQTSLYIKHYAYTDKVIKSLNKLGYDAVSSYRVSAIEIDENKSANRVRLILISFSVLIVMAILELFIVSSLFRLKKKFYSVLYFMGMPLDILKRINILELNIYTLASVIFVMVIVWILDISGLVPLVGDFRIYMDPIHYIIYVIYNFAITWLVIWRNNRKIRYF